MLLCIDKGMHIGHLRKISPMIPILISSLILMKKRRTTELIPPSIRRLLEEVELRLMILVSLALQILLIILGSRRKHDRKPWIRLIVWSTYLVADAIATFAIGLIKGKLEDISNDSGYIDSHIEMATFWVPFLLLHLGGPDAITAYSLEDNELWLRHFLGLIVQTGVSLSVFYMAWTGSRLSILSILMTIVGVVKYGERSWVLRKASNEQFRNSTLTPQQTKSKNAPDFTKEFELKRLEGYNAIPNRVVQLPVDLSVFEHDSISIEDEILTAYALSDIVKYLFVHALLSSKDQDTSQTIFKHMSPTNAFKVIEIELGLIYDLLYTKAMLVYSRWGIGLRTFNISVTSIVLVCFTFSDKEKYSRADLTISFLLLAVAIFLEIYASVTLFMSDQAVVWLRKHRKTSSFQVVTSFRLFKSHRWSNSMGQYSLLSFILKEKSTVCQKISKCLKIDELLEKQLFNGYKDVPEELKDWIFDKFKKISEEATRGRIPYTSLCTSRGSTTLEKHGYSTHDRNKDHILTWSIEVEFDQSILLWQIATDLCYYQDLDLPNIKENENVVRKCKLSRYISRYMLYLSVMCPKMLPPAGVLGQFSFQHTCSMARKNLKSFNQEISKATKKEVQKQIKTRAFKDLFDKCSSSQTRSERYEEEASLLHPACMIKDELDNVKLPVHDSTQGDQDTTLQRPEDLERKWDIISGIWLEMLAYAANQCMGNQHAQQLTQGGELLTHVWLLMAHFGLTEHFQILRPRAVSKLITK